MTRLEQFYEWRAICVQSDTVLRNYAESMRAVTATISCQVRMIIIKNYIMVTSLHFGGEKGGGE